MVVVEAEAGVMMVLVVVVAQAAAGVAVAGVAVVVVAGERDARGHYPLLISNQELQVFHLPPMGKGERRRVCTHILTSGPHCTVVPQLQPHCMCVFKY